MVALAYSNFHTFPANEFHAAHDVLLHLDQLRKLLRKLGAKGTRRLVAERVA